MLSGEPSALYCHSPLQDANFSPSMPQAYSGFYHSHPIDTAAQTSLLRRSLPRFIKRIFDITASITLLLVSSPFLLVIGLCIKRDGAAAIYTHPRIGQKGKVFSCLKFRSMVPNSDAMLEKYLAENAEARQEWLLTHKLKNDPRITPLGKVLRKYSLDEIPQLINVLKGDMSLVGPRPIVRNELANYGQDIFHYYAVKPGITGLWQVSGRNDTEYAQRVKLDSWYVSNWSLWQDMVILLKTIPAVFKCSGAY